MAVPREQVDAVLKDTSSLKSPIVEIVVGDGTAATTLRAHRALLAKSPYFVEQYAKLGDDEVSPTESRRPATDADGGRVRLPRSTSRPRS